MRRVLVPALSIGSIVLPDSAGHHLRDVLRAEAGDAVEAFDRAGNRAAATIQQLRPSVVIEVSAIEAAPPTPPLTVASAVPKGDRADSMVEKLCELGVTAFVPLRTARSVVHPEGAGKLTRWERIAAEAARQSCRAGVMRIEALVDVKNLVREVADGDSALWTPPPTPSLKGRGRSSNCVFLSTGEGVQSLIDLPRPSLLLIGPEGGWTAEEEAMMRERGLTAASLGPTILRIETAAVVAAGIARLLPL